MPMVSRKRNKLLIIWILAGALLAANVAPFHSGAWAGEPDQTQGQPGGTGTLVWAILHGVLQMIWLNPIP
jgi:hypothetical protein